MIQIDLKLTHDEIINTAGTMNILANGRIDPILNKILETKYRSGPLTSHVCGVQHIFWTRHVTSEDFLCVSRFLRKSYFLTVVCSKARC